MANARPGGPRRPGLDYYEYKRLHEQRQQDENPAAKPLKPEAQPAVSPYARPKPQSAPEARIAEPSLIDDDQDFSGNALDLPDSEMPEKKPNLLSGVKSLMKNVSRRVPEDGEPSGHQEPEREEAQPDLSELEDDADDEAAEPDDAPQIDNPIGDAFLKVKGLFQKARGRIADRRQSQPDAEPDESDSQEDEPQADSEPYASSRRMRKAAQAAEPPILAIEPVDVREVDELVAKPGTTVRAGFAEDQPFKNAPLTLEPEGEAVYNDDDDDDLPAARGTKMFGFLKKMRGRAGRAAEEADVDLTPPSGEDQRVDGSEKAGLTQLLAEGEGGPTLSRRERKALAAGKPIAAPAVANAPAAPEKPVATMPFDAPTASATPPKAVFAVDEPTQEFRPLRPRPPIKITKPAPLRAAEPELDGYDEDEDDDLPVRRAPKPPKVKKRRIYQDEDFEDEEYDRGDRFDDYDEDEYDDYDDYDEDEDRYEDEYHVSGGRRFLGFLKGLVVFILFLAVCVLALRQLEASHLISLGGLRSAVGQLSLILPSPEPTVAPVPEATVEPTLAPTPEPTALPTTQPTAAPTAMPEETPGADIAQVEPTSEAGINS